MSEERNGFIEEIRNWAKDEEKKADATISGVIESSPENAANEATEIIEKFDEGINRIKGRYCERVMKGLYQTVKTTEGKNDFVFPEKIYAVKGENGYEGIVERIFTKKKRDNSIPEKLNDETLTIMNKENGHSLTRFELLLLAGYVFVDTNSDKTESITCCVPAIDFIEKDYSYGCRMSGNSVIKNYKFTDSDGKELDKEEIKQLVEIVMHEIDNEKTADISQGEPR